jgi:hypothetical protein
MTTITDLTAAQLKRIINIKQQIEGLEGQLESIEGDGVVPIQRGPGKPKGKRKVSRAGV